MTCSTLLTVGLGVGLALGFVAATAADPPSGQHPAPYPTRMNQKFTDPGANIAEFVKRFEDAGRQVYANRQDITRAVRLKPGNVVADIGAGTGVFTFLFADQVGPGGTVFAVDISPAFIRHIGDQARRRGCERVVKPVLNTPDSAELASGSVDVVFVCDTYHHFEHPAKMLASIHRACVRGGGWSSLTSTCARTAAITSNNVLAPQKRPISGNTRPPGSSGSRARAAHDPGSFFRGVQASRSSTAWTGHFALTPGVIRTLDVSSAAG